MSLLFLPMILLGFGIACSIMLGAWFLWMKLTKGTLLEVGRVLAVVLVSGCFLWIGGGWNPRKAILFAMVFLWGSRLAVFLLTSRVFHRSEEGKYQFLMAPWKNLTARNFLYLCQVQSTAIVIFALPALVAGFNKAKGFSALEMEGFILWIVAFFGEMTADSQLWGFRAKRANRGKTCRQGLWKFSRHPNYFFEWLAWCGIALFTLASPLGWVALVCPALMYYFLTRVTGIPVTEAQALRTRGVGYKNYQKTTSAFFLRSKR